MTRIAPFVLIFTSVLLSCSSSRSDRSADKPRHPSDFAFVVGEGGGVTGMWQGFGVDSAGTVRKLSGRTLTGPGTDAGRLSLSAMNDLWKMTETSGLLNGTFTSRPGNMSRSVAVTARGSRTQVSWVQGATGMEPLDALYTRSTALLNEAARQ